MTELVIWAHSECRSTMALYREEKRLAGFFVRCNLQVGRILADCRWCEPQKRQM